MKNILSCLLAVMVLMAGCGGSSGKNNKGQEEKTRPAKFVMAEIPSMVTTQEQRADYIAEHYWDNYDFTDTALISITEVTEQGFADYINILNYFAPSLRNRSINITLNRAAADSVMLGHFMELFDKYLYDPNSPMRNEEMYIPVLEWIVASDKVDPLNKLRPQHQLEMALRNRLGTKAADFKYKTADGSTGSLYAVKADYTLIYFNNPGCSACANTQQQLIASPVINKMIDDGRLKIVAVYPDEDLAEWRKEADSKPKTWINGYDHLRAMHNESIYDLRAIPSLYLLDRDKTVLLKDADAPQVIRALIQLP